MPSVQFHGVEQVCTAFENRDVQAWSIWDKNQFMFRGIGEGELKTTLEAIAQSGTNAIYTLKVYDDISDEKKIKPKTECDGSFNFRLTEPTMTIGGYQQQRMMNYSDLDSRMKKIEDYIINGPEEDTQPEPETIQDKIGNVLLEVLSNPVKGLQLVDLVKTIVTPGYQAPERSTMHQPSPAAVGTVNDADREAQLNRLSTALDILEQQDPNLVDHLEKLAQIAQKNPVQFKTLLSMLENF